MKLGRGRAARHPRKVSRREAEVLLSGGRPGVDRDALGALLAAAAGRPLPHEMADRDLVIGAFVRAASDGARPDSAAGRPSLGGLLARALSVKLAAALAVLLLGGVAVAAKTGSLPGPIQRAAHGLLSGAGVPPPESGQVPPPAPADPEGDNDDDDGDEVSPTGAPGPRPTDEDSRTVLIELCRDYREARQDGDDIDSEDLARLADAAGGESMVSAYCETVLAVDPTEPPNDGSPGTTPSPTPTSDNETIDEGDSIAGDGGRG